MSNRVIVVGSYNVDMTINTDKFPLAGETVMGKSFTYGHGGKGANQAVASARSGATVSLLAKVGADQHGKKAIKALSHKGINTDTVRVVDDAPTGLAAITVNEHGENSIVVISGANWALKADDIDRDAHLFERADLLLTQLETPVESVFQAVKTARSHDITVILNPAPVKKLNMKILNYVTIITPNAIEAEILTGIAITDRESMEKAADILHSHGVETVLITLGPQGVFRSSCGNRELIPAIKVNAIDTVGAGDVFNGVLAAIYSNVETLDQVVKLANIGAGLSVMHTGAQEGIPDLESIKAYEQEHHIHADV